MSRKLSKEFISKQKNELLKEEKRTLIQIEELKASDPFSDPEHASDNAAVDTDVREQVGHDTVEAEIKDATRRIDNIKAALVRVEKGRYGTCEKCNELIPMPRLELVPEARYCIDCEKKLRK